MAEAAQCQSFTYNIAECLPFTDIIQYHAVIEGTEPLY